MANKFFKKNKAYNAYVIFVILCFITIIVLSILIATGKFNKNPNCGYVYNSLGTLVSNTPSATTPPMQMYRTKESSTITSGAVIAHFGMSFTVPPTPVNQKILSTLAPAQNPSHFTNSLTNLSTSTGTGTTNLSIDPSVYGITVVAFITDTAGNNLVSNLLLYSGNDYVVNNKMFPFPQPPKTVTPIISFSNTRQKSMSDVLVANMPSINYTISFIIEAFSMSSTAISQPISVSIDAYYLTYA